MFLIGQAKQEIRRESGAVPSYLLVESCGADAMELRKISVNEDSLSAQYDYVPSDFLGTSGCG